MTQDGFQSKKFLCINLQSLIEISLMRARIRCTLLLKVYLPSANFKYLTHSELGCPSADPTTSLRINNNGGGLLLLQDTQLIETLAHFARERIPERLVMFTDSALLPSLDLLLMLISIKSRSRQSCRCVWQI